MNCTKVGMGSDIAIIDVLFDIDMQLYLSKLKPSG